MRQARWKQDQVSSSNRKPPGFGIVCVPLRRRKLNLLKPIAIEKYAISLFVCLRVKDPGDKAVRVSVLVVILTLTRVVAPRLRYTQTDLMLGPVDMREVVRDRCLNKVPQLGHLAIAQDEVVSRRGVTHVGACLLIDHEVHLTLGQVSTELEERHRRRE